MKRYLIGLILALLLLAVSAAAAESVIELKGGSAIECPAVIEACKVYLAKEVKTNIFGDGRGICVSLCDSPDGCACVYPGFAWKCDG